MVDEGLDALLVQRDLAGYPPYKQLGNWVMSAWATLWAGGPLHDVESGYRIFRARGPRQRPRLLPGLQVLRDRRGRHRPVAARVQGPQRRARAGADLPVADVA